MDYCNVDCYKISVQFAPRPNLSLRVANVDPTRNWNPEPRVINPDGNHSLPSDMEREVGWRRRGNTSTVIE